MDHHHLRTVVVAGAGRSGTTWVGEVLTSCEDCFPVFEPMNVERVAKAPTWGQASGFPGPYFAANAERPEWREFYQAVCERQISNAWTRQDWVHVPQVLDGVPVLGRMAYRLARMRNGWEYGSARKCILKMIRANLILPWLVKQFPLDVVFVMRHPCAVVGSRLRLGWPSTLEELSAQEDLRALLEPWWPIVCEAKSDVQKMAVLWCVENLVPLWLASRGSLQPRLYEQLVADRHEAMGRIVEELSLKRTAGTELAIDRLVSTPSAAKTGRHEWHGPLSRDEGEQVLEICHAFGIHLYDRMVMPRVPSETTSGEWRKCVDGRVSELFGGESRGTATSTA